MPFVSVIGTVALGSACGGQGDVGRADTDVMPAVVTVTATDYAFEAPDTLQAGWTTFRVVNDGDVLHAPMIVRLEEGRTLDGFREAYAEAWEKGGPWNALGLLGGIVAPPRKGRRQTPRCTWRRVSTPGTALCTGRAASLTWLDTT